jgi:hypothetical protein
MTESSIAPAEAAPRRRWPLWRKLLAYAALAGVALVSIYFVDLKVHRAGLMPASPASR